MVDSLRLSSLYINQSYSVFHVTVRSRFRSVDCRIATVHEALPSQMSLVTAQRCNNLRSFTPLAKTAIRVSPVSDDVYIS